MSSVLGCTVFEEPVLEEIDAAEPVETQDAGQDAEAPAEDTGMSEQDAAALPDTAVSVDSSEPDAEAPSCMLKGIDPMDTCTGDIVINEVDGSGNDFVEIYNRGTSAVDISGWILADDSGGSPAVPEGAIIPANTMLQPKHFLYVWANLEGETGPNTGMWFDSCIPATPSPCLHANWGVTSGGERLYLVNRALEIVCAVNYPNAVYAGEAYGRIPDGSPMLCPTMPSPGEANVLSTLR